MSTSRTYQNCQTEYEARLGSSSLNCHNRRYMHLLILYITSLDAFAAQRAKHSEPRCNLCSSPVDSLSDIWGLAFPIWLKADEQHVHVDVQTDTAEHNIHSD